MKNSWFSLMKSIARVLFILILFQGCKTEYPKPNFIFFLVDDLGYSDVGCFGSDYYETPNIDRLADEGMKFTSAYAGSTICSPTRASILTGKYAGRLHITAPIPIISYKRQASEGKITPLKDPDYVMNLPLEEVTIAEALKPAGYATASIGKWHVCDEPEYFPEYQGFDINVAGDGHGATKNYFYPYYNRWRMTEGYPWLEWNTLPDGVPGEYLTDRLTVEAVRFIEENKERPFFLYFAHYAVHTPVQAKDSLIQKYMNQPGDTLKGHIHPEYAAMIESVDQSMGALLRKLEDLDLADNTIIIFTSDNGGHRQWTTNYPFRGHKGNFYEGGIRVPLIIKWPGVTTAGSVSDFPVISNDYYPTMLEMADLPLKPEQHLDGLSLLPLIKNESELNREALYWHYPHYTSLCGVVRYHDWKLIEFLGDGRLELYDLKNDIEEKNDLAEVNPEMAEKLQQMLAGWRESVNAQMPEANPDYVKK
ncbi:MAG: sulfatase [Bacteroidales bacterium]|nr:sulfatase [Bacteroidales bacterium]